MARKTTLTATMPNGQQATRTTNHEYKFVVCVQHHPDTYWYEKTRGTWTDVSWHSRLDLAAKKADELRKYPDAYSEVEVVAVN